ncbi:MAG TPA: patatin-like phospholipase family protein [Actinomycetota bacterium]|nr:patatin-like phospholipase family protein [Actinomycetota bacterium]
MAEDRAPHTAFVLGGGGHNGAYEVGMLRALLERGVRPDLVVGTSVGALNGAAVAADPSLEMVARLREAWVSLNQQSVFGGSILAGAAHFVRSRTHMHSNAGLRRLIDTLLPARTFDELAVPFQCVAASIERAEERWFDSGPLADAILASAAIPGVLPPVRIGDQHYIDGGVVNSIPVSRAVDLGAREIWVLHVGRIDAPLTAPRTPLQVALVTFEIARRHRFARDLGSLPEGVVAHVLPTGEPKRPSLKQLNYRDFKAVSRRIERAYGEACKYLDRVLGD